MSDEPYCPRRTDAFDFSSRSESNEAQRGENISANFLAGGPAEEVRPDGEASTSDPSVGKSANDVVEDPEELLPPYSADGNGDDDKEGEEEEEGGGTYPSDIKESLPDYLESQARNNLNLGGEPSAGSASTSAFQLPIRTWRIVQSKDERWVKKVFEGSEVIYWVWNKEIKKMFSTEKRTYISNSETYPEVAVLSITLKKPSRFMISVPGRTLMATVYVRPVGGEAWTFDMPDDRYAVDGEMRLRWEEKMGEFELVDRDNWRVLARYSTLPCALEVEGQIGRLEIFVGDDRVKRFALPSLVCVEQGIEALRERKKGRAAGSGKSGGKELIRRDNDKAGSRGRDSENS